MTNFQSVTHRSTAAWLSPERAVVVVPILAGLAFAAALASAVIAPQMVHLRERRSIVDVMEQKSEALTDLAETLAQRRLQQAEVMAQQRRLLALIAGTAELETLLSQLNDLASKHQVLISSTVPGKVMRAPMPVASNEARAAGAQSQVGGDPLLMQGLEKRSARIQVNGPFIQVLEFLRSLEKLEVFVVTDDMSVVATRSSSDDEATTVRLGLTLSAYGASDTSSDEGAS